VSHRIAQNKKPHTIAKTVILPAAIEMVQTMIGEKCAQHLRNIPISSDTVSRRIADISEDLEEQLIEKVRSKHFVIQTDEATDCSLRAIC
jgi:glutamine synthetase type III